MPLYNLACKNTLTAEQRKRIAESITRTHCDITGAPAEFVNVAFLQGFALHDNMAISAIGGVRSGGNRNLELTETLQKSIQHGIATAAGLALNEIEVNLIGIPANWNMEGGKVLPDPGAEDEWLDRTKPNVR